LTSVIKAPSGIIARPQLLASVKCVTRLAPTLHFIAGTPAQRAQPFRQRSDISPVLDYQERKAIMALTSTQTAITELYLGAFNRAPEKSGLQFWDAQLAAGKSFAEVVDTVFSLPVVKAIYPDTMSTNDFLTAVYTNVFGKAPDADGLAYWNTQLAAGQSRGNVVTKMIDAGLATPDGTPGKAFIANRLDAATYAADLQLARGTEVDDHKLTDLFMSIDDSAANLALAKAAIDKATPVPVFASAENTTATATAATDLFVFGQAPSPNFQTINGLQRGDLLNLALPDQTNGDFHLAATTSAAAVDSHGEWYYDAPAQDLTYWSDAAASSAKVHLTGVPSLTVDANAVFTIG
jgi:hypothetical protein